MRKALLFAALCVAALCEAQVGTWKAHMSYYVPQQIVKAGDSHIYVRASNSLYKYNLNDHSITTYDRSQQLNDTYIRSIAWNNSVKRLLVMYDNSNLDIIDTNDNVHNVSSIYSKSMTQNKTINNVYMYQQFAFLCTNFGVVKLNLEKGEVAETYMLNEKVSHVCVSGNTLYLRYQRTDGATFLKGDMGTNLIDSHNWTVTTTYPQEIYTYYSDITNQGEAYKELVATLNPGGPKYNNFGFLRVKNGKLYSCSSNARSSVARPGTVQVLNNGEWSFLQDDIKGVDGTEASNWAFNNSFYVDEDPRDSKHVMVAAREGLFEYYDGKLEKYYHKDNSMLNTATTSNRYVIVSGLTYDDKGNLWLLQQQVLENAVMGIDTEGEWHSYYQDILMSNDKSLPGLMGLIIDSRRYLWFVNYYFDNPSFYCFDTDSKRIVNYMNELVNQDGVIADTYVPHCLAEDMDGNLWLGTSIGLYEIEASTLGSQLQYVTQVKVPRNDGTNYADYLMDGVDISCIAVDQANRKWIGTNGAGVYLISADNMEQLENFTAANSPLLSDNIESIAIDHATGEVFIGTDLGLNSYMSDATAVSIEMTKDDVYAYPNPVVSGYDGLITVVGLTRDADVKILTVNGQLVAQGRSNGGTFTWNGRDSRGHRVASGVYMVATAKSDGSKGTVCKIAVIR